MNKKVIKIKDKVNSPIGVYTIGELDDMGHIEFEVFVIDRKIRGERLQFNQYFANLKNMPNPADDGLGWQISKTSYLSRTKQFKGFKV